MKKIVISLSDYQKDVSETIDYLNKHCECIVHPFADYTVLSDDMLVITDDEYVVQNCINYNVPYVVVFHEENYYSGSRFPSGCYAIDGLEDVDFDYLCMVYQRSKGLPLEILQTERLIIREITVADVSRLFELYEDREVTCYMEDLFRPQEKEEEYTKKYIDNVYGFYGYGMWLIILKETGEIIGRCGLECKEGSADFDDFEVEAASDTNDCKERFYGLELGFMLGKKYWHKGYAFEACNAVLKYGNEHLYTNSFRAIVHKDNLASRRLCEKLGFTADNSYYKDYISYIKTY